ncbi:nodulation protein NolB [Ensifer sesbaniae]|uniref:nodulation protein NolB n=1 Tax=Ensifer sesbaniae TaxID=1214071 RepID=UPI001AED6296|nr:nodulation protein NolB [Ensifer sesbaniae]
MMPVNSISASLVDFVPKVASPSLGEQAQFERALAQAAASTRNDTGFSPATAAPVPPQLDVQRATPPPSSRGDRVLQTLSSMYREQTVGSAGLDHQVGLAKSAPTRPAQKLPVEGAVAATSTGPDFESTMSNLRDLYSGVTKVSLISKGVSGITSSVNTLIKQG